MKFFGKELKFNNNKVYHAGDKPTPSEIGAAAASHGTHVTYSTTAPLANGTASAGSASTVARTDHVHPLQTNISGNAGTATKATQDSAGQQINTTYIKGLSVSGKTITYTKGDGTKGTITTQDTNTTYSTGTASALGLTKLYTGTGTATDGTMTQAAIKTALDGKAASSHTHSYLPLSGGTLTGSLKISGNNKDLVIGAGTGDVYINNTASGKYIQMKDDGLLSYSGSKIYHAGDKPTASEVGALATSGGTMSGNITLNNGKGIYGKTAEALTDSEGATVAAGTSGGLLVYNTSHNLHLGALVYDKNLVTGNTYLNGAVNMFVRTNKGYVAMQPERTSTMTFYKTYSNTNVPLRSSVSAGTYLAGNQGTALLNSTATAGSYVTVAKTNSTNGYFTLNSFKEGMFLSYTAKSTVDAGTNAVTKTVKLIDEAGNTQFPGTVTASAFSGNATSATKLQTARTINGTNFNGSGNITTANWGTARNITIGNTTKSVNGSANVSWTAAEIGVASINDSTTATGTVWSSNKTQVQINTSYNTMSQKVDALEESINRDFVSKNGSTMTGDLTIKKSNGAAAKLNVHRTINSNDMQGTIDIYAHNGGSVSLSTNNKTSGKQASSYVFGGDAFWSPRNADGVVPDIGTSSYRFKKAWLTDIDATGTINLKGIIYGKNNIALDRGSLWLQGTGSNLTCDYLRFGTNIMASSDNKLIYFIDTSGNRATVDCGELRATQCNIAGKKLFIQSGTPSGVATGDVWIQI